MSLYMIAVIVDKGKTLGYRLFNFDGKGGNGIKNVPTESIKSVLSAGKTTINNLGLSGGNLVGLNGSVDRYPKVNLKGDLVSSKSPLIILNQIGNAGYTVVDYKGKVKKARNTDVVEYAKSNGIANGKVVSNNNVEFISSIVGSYDMISVAPSKVKNNDDVKIHLSIGNNANNSVGKNTKVEVEVEIEENDVFNCMSDIQKKVLKAYYVWFTVDKYKSFAKSIRLNIALDKAEKLSELRGEDKWEFGGVWDSGYMGGAKCELGHTLRYEYYAIPEATRDDPSTRIIFGETCASDFFNISTDDMKSLVKTRTIMSDEIKLMADIIVNEREEEYCNKLSLLYEVLDKLGSEDKIVDAFGSKVGNTLIAFRKCNLPFPMSLAIEASKVASKDVKGFLYKVLPEYKGDIEKVYENKSGSYILDVAKEYLDFIVTNKLEGEYAYDPFNENIKRRDVGRYNKETRQRRLYLLNRIKRNILCRKYNIIEVCSILDVLSKYINLGSQLENKIDVSFDEELKRVFKARVSYIANDFALSADNKEDLNKRIVLINALGFTEYYRSGRFYSTAESFRGRILSYETDLDVVFTQVYMCEDSFGEITKEFISYVKDKDEAEKAERRAIEEREKYEAEQKRIEEERVKEELKKKAEESKSKKSSRRENKLDILRELMEKHKGMSEDAGIKTAKAILDKKKKYSELTDRQKWRIDYTIELYKRYENGEDLNDTKENKKVEDNNTYNLDEHSDIKDRVQKVIDYSDKEEFKKVTDKYPKVLAIAKTIMKRAKASDRQLKYIDKAIEIIDEA